MSKNGRLAIVTGGAGLGIGCGVTRALALDRWHVLVVDRDAQLASQLADELLAAGASVRVLAIDLLDKTATQRTVDEALNWVGRIDGLVNSAGIGCNAPIHDLSDDLFDVAFNLNVRAALRLVRAAVEPLAASRGAIVNVSSVHGRQPLPSFSGYAATKGAIEAMTRGWAVDLGPQGIRVNCVVPGMVDCPQTRAVMATVTDDVEGYLQDWTRRRQLMPELISNQDVGQLVAYLLGDRSRGITGQCIVIDAGTTLMLTDRD